MFMHVMFSLPKAAVAAAAVIAVHTGQSAEVSLSDQELEVSAR